MRSEWSVNISLTQCLYVQAWGAQTRLYTFCVPNLLPLVSRHVVLLSHLSAQIQQSPLNQAVRIPRWSSADRRNLLGFS
ncbi:hypothetical protein HYC85_028395 [Camellia sinensis]|uniref:Uncharacterized protein n=1 Tax=Camellia sinensis TaxID=4442 RepID=A0A7J7FZ36_CAMSI|nr:hypothetical protein HYC85_028395 [Camellia sinensis]